MSFKRIFGGIGIVALLSLLSSVASAQGVVGSPHDLQPETTNTSETCVFCHTPHGSSTSAAVPLWNKTLPNPAIYTRYSSLNTSTLSGEEAPVGSVSLACLSCHDGSQAVDTVLNTPGRGMGANFPAGTQIDAGVLWSDGRAFRYRCLARICETITPSVSSTAVVDSLAATLTARPTRPTLVIRTSTHLKRLRSTRTLRGGSIRKDAEPDA